MKLERERRYFVRAREDDGEFGGYCSDRAGNARFGRYRSTTVVLEPGNLLAIRHFFLASLSATFDALSQRCA